MCYSVLSRLVAFVLIVAVFAKVWALKFYGFEPTHLFTSVQHLKVALAAEMTIALWLFWGGGAAACRSATLGLISVFIAANVYLLTLGESSCGCFGALNVSPTLMLGLDGLMFLLLLFNSVERNAVEGSSVEGASVIEGKLSTVVRASEFGHASGLQGSEVDDQSVTLLSETLASASERGRTGNSASIATGKWGGASAVPWILVSVFALSYLVLPKFSQPENVLPSAHRSEATTSDSTIWKLVQPVRFKLLDFKGLVGGKLPLLELIEPEFDFETGNWIVFFKNSQCKNCQAILPRLVAASGKLKHWRLVLIDVSPEQGIAGSKGPVSQGRIKLPGNDRLVARPGIIELVDGKIVFANENLDEALEYVESLEFARSFYLSNSKERE